jgi:hypothetical protein
MSDMMRCVECGYEQQPTDPVPFDPPGHRKEIWWTNEIGNRSVRGLRCPDCSKRRHKPGEFYTGNEEGEF